MDIYAEQNFEKGTKFYSSCRVTVFSKTAHFQKQKNAAGVIWRNSAKQCGIKF